MSRLGWAPCLLASLCFAGPHLSVMLRAQSEDYLRWTAQHAEAIGTAGYRRGRVGGLFDMRGLKTERSYNYKLAATWFTPEAIRATARMLQIRSRLSDAETRQLVAEADAVQGTVIIVEVDPREGSGVIPNDWEAFLQPKNDPARAVRGTLSPQLREVKAFAGVLRRNYDYDRFWVTFPVKKDSVSVLGDGDRIAELIVRIHEKEGRVEWPVPDSLRALAR